MYKNLSKIVICLFCVFFPYYVYSHPNWEMHAEDMMAVFGFKESNSIKEWMKFISSDMIDKHNPFYSNLCENHQGFKCKHRLLFHWGYNAKPWNSALEQKVKDYCEQKDLNLESNLRIFQSEIRSEQKRRNGLINKKTENLFGFAQGGKDASYALFFASMAYNIHLIGDYTSDNTDLDGLQPIEEIIGLIVNDIRSLDKGESKLIIKKIIDINKKYPEPQRKADVLMAYLKKEIPGFIKRSQQGSIYRRLEKRGFLFKK